MFNLPGRLLRLPEGAMCENEGHATVPATHAVQGETDSMGYETLCFCTPCYEQYRERADQPNEGTCEWCSQPSTSLRPYRDIDEGSSGPVYDVCQSCRREANKRAREELDSYYDED